jgi:hypothetical protein
MITLNELTTGFSEALRVPLDEVQDVAARQHQAGLIAPVQPGRKRMSVADGARLLVGVMVMRIEGAATSAAALTADIERLTRLKHGAQLYFDTDFILPEDYTGAVAEILSALADPYRRQRARDWIGRVGLARGGGRMAGWIEVRAPEAEQWEDFDYAASPDDLVVILDGAPVVRRIEVRISALLPIAQLLA